MEDTYSTQAIVLKRSTFKEYDMKVFLYTKNYGKIELVVKGAKRLKSKIAGHVEPLNLANVMAVRGKQYDYLGSAINQNAFLNIKNDLEKIALASKAIKIFNEQVKPELCDENLFWFLHDFLVELDKKTPNDYSLTYSAFVLKLVQILGFQPDLNLCSVCQKNIGDFKSFFYNQKGELVCDCCSVDNRVPINQDSVKVLKFILNNNFDKIFKLKINQKNNKEANNFIGSFFNYI